MRKLSKVLCLLLACVIVVGAMPQTAQAAGKLRPYSLSSSLVEGFLLKANGEVWYVNQGEDKLLPDGTYSLLPPMRVMTGAVALGEGNAFIDKNFEIWKDFCTAYILLSNGDLYQGWISYENNQPVFGKRLILTGVSELRNNLFLKDGDLYCLMDQSTPLVAKDVIAFAGIGDGSANVDAAYVTRDHVLHYHYNTDTTSSGKSKTWSELPGFTQVYAGKLKATRDTFFAVSEDGALYAWGDNTYGQVGNGGGNYRLRNNGVVFMGAKSGDIIGLWLQEPIPVKVMDSVTALYLDKNAVYARDAAGVLWTWGDAEEGFKAPLIVYNKQWSIDQDKIIVPDLTFFSPRRSETDQPVYTGINSASINNSLYCYEFKADGTITYTMNHYQTAFKFSDLVNLPNGEMPTEIVEPFWDVVATEWYAEPVRWAVGKGITNGTSDDEFSPGQDCTQAHIITFLWRAYGSPEPSSAASPFTDVTDPSAWYYKAALWAAEKGVANAGTTFKPNDPCTRSQAVTYLWRAAGSPAATSSKSFKDVPADAAYATAVAWAIQKGVTDGVTSTTFEPNTVCTRGHIVTFLYRALAK